MRPDASFEDNIQTNNNNNDDTVSPAMMICTKLAGRAIIRVVGRCEEGQENNNLDLSECQLMQVPDAVYHLMRHTEVKSCNLTGNAITKIPPKFAINFSLITDLNLSHNQVSKLPDEFDNLSELQNVDISHNAFVCLPQTVFVMPKLSILNASHNFIVDINMERLKQCPSLQEINLEANPLSRPVRESLDDISTFKVSFTAVEEDDWDDEDME